ncbi:hypothetical protein KVR01_006757 [Diaporthe batatas]|uniref:uncharacterized protein n=1 Tax=Diaporthe batatas TaxID=748121 RepID=UPI001D043730|nr:uncharacterized protein KVR01_006757 [Diaporthe batatas]KAG8163460.1 hypothetical protein KVR01_006757 [Diaporthe batatas]
MADQPARPKEDKQTSPLRSKIVRSQKISAAASGHSPSPSPSSERADVPTPLPRYDGYQDSSAPDRAPPVPRSHTPGHLSSKSQVSRPPSAPAPNAPPVSIRNAAPASSSAANRPRENGEQRPDGRPESRGDASASGARPPALRSTSAIAGKPAPPAATNGTARSSNAHRTSATTTSKHPAAGTYKPFPPLASPTSSIHVPPAPSSGMYWSRAPVSGRPHPALRAHTTTMIGSNIYVFGGCDSRACFNDLHVLDADAFHWSQPYVSGDIPVPLRAMTCTAVGKKLVIFGGGDGPAYYNEVYVLDTVNFRWTKPRILGDRVPSKRRAHTACLYKNGIYVFGGGDGVRALNDIWRLDVSDLSKMSWKLISSPTDEAGNSKTRSPGGGGAPGRESKPKARGYHTANIVDGKLIIFGGSDGGECFNDVWVYDIETHAWKSAPVSGTFRRLSHTATIVGSYLFVIGGHDGNEYSNDVLLLNLVQMTWDKRRVYGLPPSGRGYHGTVLHDSRLLTIGGFDGGEVFGDVWILEMAVHAYYSQISHFQIEL